MQSKVGRKTYKKKRNARHGAFVSWWKSKKKCYDCKKGYASYVMDLDHVYGNKVGSISALASGNCSLITLLKEIAKCEVVCANCHRERTHQRRTRQDRMRHAGRKKVRGGMERPAEDLSKLAETYARWRAEVYEACGSTRPAASRKRRKAHT